MKKYKVTILTQSSGLVDLIISEGEDLQKVQAETLLKYGTFITIKTTEL